MMALIQTGAVNFIDIAREQARASVWYAYAITPIGAAAVIKK